MIRALFYLLLWLPCVALTVLKMSRALEADRNREAALCAPVLFMFGLLAFVDLAEAVSSWKSGAK